MKIKGTCTRCQRGFMGEQVADAGGRCPWCGEPLNADYAVTLVQTLREIDEAGTALERALTALADLDPALRVDEGSVLGEAVRQVRRTGAGALAAS